MRAEPEFLREGGLAAHGLARPDDCVFAHEAQINAPPVYRVKAGCVDVSGETVPMGRKAETPASEFWTRMTQAWRRHGLPVSQNGVAVKLNMSQGSTRRWYTGEGYPEIPQLIEIARLGRCSIHWLLTNEGPESLVPDPDTADLLRHWKVLEPEGRAAVLRMAKMEHAAQFTGDADARAAFERKLEEHTRLAHDRAKRK